jgi:hypothetical protein
VTGHTEVVRTRRILTLLCFLVALGAAPAEAAAPGDGTLSIRDARGMVQLTSRGTMIGRIASGKLTVIDPNPYDNRRAIVLGAEKRVTSRNLKTTVYSGQDIRLRVTGGRANVRFNGRGIHLSAVGRGSGLLDGTGDVSTGVFFDGVWSLNDEDYHSLPDVLTGFDLVGPPRERS